MNMIRNMRLVLAGVLLGLATTIAAPLKGTDPSNEKKQYEYLKKAKYFEIRAQLEAGELSLEEAQTKWRKALKKLVKKEGK
jgi:hypothetical protein|tara:strand:+ start:2412 stop:2654 length:243 start_codon:yes stop_codon:yes gene_type:complete